VKILAYNPGHDGAAVLLDGDRLVYCLESEKDDGLRHDRASLGLILRSLSLDEPPDAIAVSGFYKFTPYNVAADVPPESWPPIEAGYFSEGDDGVTASTARIAGRDIRRFSSSHVRSHIMCSYGLSPFPQGQPCYALIWEGELGSFYHVDEQLTIRKVGDVLGTPGNKYLFLWVLATGRFDGEAAGKVMALAAYGRRRPPSTDEKDVIDAILGLKHTELWRHVYGLADSPFSRSRYFKIGLDSQEFRDLAWQFSVALFDRFYQFAKTHLAPGLPLLIAGGCGLNCEWNTQWRNCGLFSKVFVPPCANDSGVALGAAIDARRHYTGRAKLEWSVYAGDPFVDESPAAEEFETGPIDLTEVCRRLLDGQVIGWVQGRYEMGPRALGNRSLLAAPFSTEIRDRLNTIKQREPFRPIAPICLEEEFSRHFDQQGSSPHMLYFQRVLSPELGAVTHADGSARAQSVNDAQNPEICALLREFRRQSGVGVLCNTSLNFKGRGFVNRTSQLLALAQARGIDGVVVGRRFWASRKLVGAT
jgi:predicted NodU family carbamoyl transferase